MPLTHIFSCHKLIIPFYPMSSGYKKRERERERQRTASRIEAKSLSKLFCLNGAKSANREWRKEISTCSTAASSFICLLLLSSLCLATRQQGRGLDTAQLLSSASFSHFFLHFCCPSCLPVVVTLRVFSAFVCHCVRSHTTTEPTTWRMRNLWGSTSNKLHSNKAEKVQEAVQEQPE